MSQGLSVVHQKRFWKFARERFCRGLMGVIRGFALVISGLFCAVSNMVVCLQRSLATKSAIGASDSEKAAIKRRSMPQDHAEAESFGEHENFSTTDAEMFLGSEWNRFAPEIVF